MNLAARGAKVVVNDMDAAAADSVVAEIKAAGGVARASLLQTVHVVALVSQPPPRHHRGLLPPPHTLHA
jgi:hypothetical protein